MHAGHDEIEAFENVVRIVERAVRTDVGLDALQNAKTAAVAAIDAVDLTMLLDDCVNAQAACIMRRLRVVGDAKVAVAAGAGSLRHFLKRMHAIGESGVNVEETFEILLADEFGQLTASRQCDLVGALA